MYFVERSISLNGDIFFHFCFLQGRLKKNTELILNPCISIGLLWRTHFSPASHCGCLCSVLLLLTIIPSGLFHKSMSLWVGLMSPEGRRHTQC